MKKTTLWTKNFTIITLGTLISAMGGVAMSLAMTLVVFDQTTSTWLSGLFAAASMVPGMTLPFFLAPVIDRCNRKRLIVGLDYTSGVLYLLFLWYIRRAGFQYGAYVVFSFILGCIGAVYGLGYECWYPDLIPQGQSQRGYAVSSLIYPLTQALMTPVAAVIYKKWGVEVLILAEGILLLTAASFEACITWQHVPVPRAGEKHLMEQIRDYGRELVEGIRYLKREKGVRNIYAYMTVTNAGASGTYMMTMAHFQTSRNLTTEMYSFLTTAETLGRAIGGAVHYLFKIPQKKRYWLTVRVYLLYELLDGVMLFLAYPLMLVVRFVLGFMGVNTATLRQAAVQSYLPSEIRGRVNGLIHVLISMGMLLVQLLAGALGEVLPYRWTAVIFAACSLLGVCFFIIRNREDVRKIYEFEKEEPLPYGWSGTFASALVFP